MSCRSFGAAGAVISRSVNDRGGIGWLTGFDEWLCRCGLASNGPPGEDVHVDRHGATRRDLLTLHGRIANQPAHYVEARVSLDPPYELSVIGHVEEGGLFYPHLQLTATYTTVPGSNRLVIHDVVENRGAEPAEMQLLYHCNLGMPFLAAGSRVLAPIRELSPISLRGRGDNTLDTGGPAQFQGVYCYCRSPAAKYLRCSTTTPRTKAWPWANRQELPCFTV